MPSYDILFIISPSGFFGVPEEGMAVHPTGTEFTTPPFNPLLGGFVGHGTLPKYRDSPLTQEVVIGGAAAKFNDNYLIIRLDAPDDRTAVDRAMELASRLCLFLSVYEGKYFRAEVVRGLNKAEGRSVPIPKTARWSARIYNLPQLQAAIREAAATSALADPLLEKATAYLHHALFQQEERMRIDSGTFHFKLVTSEIFLNCYKAASTILGDPSVDGDYQSRYKRFGMQRELWKDGETLRGLRNHYDIAHYATDWGPLDNVQTQEAFALNTARQVIIAYANWLRSSTGTP